MLGLEKQGYEKGSIQACTDGEQENRVTCGETCGKKSLSKNEVLLQETRKTRYKYAKTSREG